MQKDPIFCHHLNANILNTVQKLTKIPTTCQMSSFHKHEEKEVTTVWVCCHCLEAGCSRYSQNQCMYKHIKETHHALCYNFEQNILWCYKCDESLHQMLSDNIESDETTAYKNFDTIVGNFDRIIYKLKNKNEDNKQVKVFQIPNIKEEVKDKRVDKIYGLNNLGNTCFFNSVMQSILNSQLFISYIDKHKSKFAGDSLPIEILRLTKESTHKAKNPKLVFRELIKSNKKYGYYNQQDANECFVYLLEILEKYFEKFKLEDNPFLGYYVYETKCMQCDFDEYFFEQSSMLLLDLSHVADHHSTKDKIYEIIKQRIDKNENLIPIKNELISRHKFVEKSGFNLKHERISKKLLLLKNQSQCSQMEFLIQEYFDFFVYSQKKHNFICEKCKKNSTYGFKKNYIYSPPPLLCICLKRFSQTSFFSFKKSSKSVKVDPLIDLTNYVLDCDKNNNKKIIYELYAAVHHSGGLGGGHYTAYVKKESGQWYYVSDSYYSETSIDHVIKSEPYMLYYRALF